MGTIIYENRNKIVDLENDEEKTQEHIGIMAAVSILIISMMIIAIKTSLFAALSLTAQVVFTGSLIMIFLALIWSLKEEKKETDVKALLFVGMILMIPVFI